MGLGCADWSPAYLQLVRQSSSPHLLRMRQPASLCSETRSGKGGDGVSAWAQQPPFPPLCQILGLSPYLIDTPKEGEKLAEKGSTHAGNVHKGSLEVGVGSE